MQNTETSIDLSVYRPYEVDDLKRVGNKHDGGYVVHMPSLQKVECLLNYGVGYNVSFEKKFSQMTGQPVYAFDPTLSAFSYVKDELTAGQLYTGSKHLLRWLLWKVQKKRLPSQGICFVEEGVAGSNEGMYKTLAYHIKKYGLESKKIFLKMDIEGYEYDVLNDDSFYLYIDNMVQMIFEFHYVKERLAELTNIMKRLEQTHTLVHIHGNNNAGTFNYQDKNVLEAMEVVFLHNSLIHKRSFSQKSYPVEGLDYPCNWRRKDIPVDFFK